jgi:hypothetical protein
MEPMNTWWKIIGDWKLDNSITPGDGFPADGFVKDGTLVILKAGEGVNLFWADGRDMPCSAHVPNVPSTPDSQPLVTFAGKNFRCVIQEFTSIPLDSTSQLTVKLAMSVGELGPTTGNTGTFIAQAVPGPPNHGQHGHEKPGN